ncbi:hypothetical protein ES705_24905 [subsurface metagenome]
MWKKKLPGLTPSNGNFGILLTLVWLASLSYLAHLLGYL